MGKFDEFVRKLDADCEKFVSRESKELKEVGDRNVRLLDLLFDRLSLHCNNPYCQWPIQITREFDYKAPFIGPICATCHDLYHAISFMNTQLTRPKWFQLAHDEWLREAKAMKERKDKGGSGGIT